MTDQRVIEQHNIIQVTSLSIFNIYFCCIDYCINDIILLKNYKKTKKYQMIASIFFYFHYKYYTTILFNILLFSL